jgi:aldose 1-epimerase
VSERVQLTGSTGLSAELDSYGARLIRLVLPDVDGSPRDVVLGFDTIEGYQTHPDLFFGATIGRVANRIAGARYTLDGEEFLLTANEGQNHLHGGGQHRFDRSDWKPVVVDESAVRFAHTSPHLEEGYPGAVDADVLYRLTDDSLEIEYRATTDRRTPMNMTHHTYWNLDGNTGGTIDGHLLQVMAEHYTPIDTDLIPLGHLEPVEGTPFDFRSPAAIGARADALASEPGDGIDHNFAISDWDSALRTVARVTDSSGRLAMEVSATQPGLQVYSGNHLTPVVGKGGVVYPTRGGLCLEPQHFPDSLHNPGFPSIILEPGETYRQTTVYRFTTA